MNKFPRLLLKSVTAFSEPSNLDYTFFNPHPADLDISGFEISVDPDPPAPQKPADQYLHCFPLCIFKHAFLSMQVNQIKMEKDHRS